MSESPEEEDRTVYLPKGAAPPPAQQSQVPAPPLGAPAPPSQSPPARGAPQQIADGAVLNGIYRITRFIAKGGMGEVYEAVNIHQPDDRVAIKVMLQHLAEDELVAAMFAKEGATLTRLHHEAIVPYRLAARDTEGRPYIVTEFIPGPSLEQRLGQLKLSDAEFLGIAQKLAAGLGTAHTLGAIHRDIAPDNILLVGGDPMRPKIIDFGIAKDVREPSGTIVGDGFAGKLGYVAPEQLGEYGRNVGGWTDIYSLALTLRAVVAGKRSDMGGSMADAVRKRMSVPDLSDIPPPFRAAFEAALQPDPARRPQSMAAFNVMLTSGAVSSGMGAGIGGAAEIGTTQLVPPAPLAADGILDKLRKLMPAGAGQNRLPLLIGGGAAALIAVVGLVIAVSLGGDDAAAPDSAASDSGGAPSVAAAPAPPPLAPGTPEFAALAQSVSATVPCSWLTLADAGSGAARFSGAAAVPAAAQTQVGNALQAAGARVPTLDFANVRTFPQSTCAVLDALREARGGTVKIDTPQTTYEIRNEAVEMSSGLREPKPHAKVLLQISSTAPLRHWALAFIYDFEDPMIADSRKIIEAVELYKGSYSPQNVNFPLPYDPETSRPENVGAVIISSETPLPANITKYDANWPQRFREGAKANGWKVDAVWFRVEDRQPG